MSGPWVRSVGVNTPQNCKFDGLLLVFFGLLFRRRQALEALQQFLFGHAFDGDLGVVGVDAGTLEAALDEAVADAVKAYPAIKRPTYPDRSGASFPAGSSQSEILTRDVIAQMTPEAVNQARKAGMIPGFAADAS